MNEQLRLRWFVLNYFSISLYRLGVRAKPPAWHSEENGIKKQGMGDPSETVESKDQNSETSKMTTLEEPRPSIRLRTKSSPEFSRKDQNVSKNIRYDETEHPLQRVGFTLLSF